MSDAAFREAVDALIFAAGSAAGITFSTGGAVNHPAAQRLLAAEARLLALYAEAQQQGERDQLALAEQVAEATARMEQGRAERQGEVYEVTSVNGVCEVVLYEGPFKPGDRVRVVKEGT